MVKRRMFFCLVLLLATSFLFFSYTARFGYGVLLPRITDDLRLSKVEAGPAYSFTYCYTPCFQLPQEGFSIDLALKLFTYYVLSMAWAWR